MFKTLNFDSSYWFVVSRLSLVQLKMPFGTPCQHLLSSIKTETVSGIPSLTGQDENQVISHVPRYRLDSETCDPQILLSSRGG
jgi:hypothetical protein